MSSSVPLSLWPDPESLGTATDLYQLTMMAGYHQSGLAKAQATFELFVRKLPEKRAYLVFAGLEQFVADLMRIAFSDEQILYLRSLDVFRNVNDSFFESLRAFRFEGDVWSVPEGTIVFAGEPLMRVVAPLPQAQLVETHLIASLNYPTLVASKAARVVEAAAGKPVFDFGARRGHGPHAAFLAARASYIAGVSGTSHVEAARRLGIPPVGTMAHSWIQSFPNETLAFEAFAKVFGSSSILLVDTYQTLEGVRRAARIDPPPKAIRIDSGDLASLAGRARSILDENDRASVQIVVSGDLDEYKIADLVRQGAPIDGFGVGTQLITSADSPALSMVYKLVELEGQGKIKLSSGKKTYPMAKQIHRLCNASGVFSCDRISLADEPALGEPLLVPIVRRGELIGPLPALNAIRARFQAQFGRIPHALRGPSAREVYRLEYSDALQTKARELGVI